MYVSLTYNYGNLARVTNEMLSLRTRKVEDNSMNLPSQGFAYNTNDGHRASEVNDLI